MGVLEDLFVKAKDAVGVIGEKAGQFMDVSKLNIRKVELENDLKTEYENLGKIVYKSEKNQKRDDAAINYEIAQIDNISMQIEDVKNQIAVMKNKTICKSCGQANEMSSTYCAKCGSALSKECECGKDAECSDKSEDDDFSEFDE